MRMGTPQRQRFRFPHTVRRLIQLYQTLSPSPRVRRAFAGRKIEQLAPDVDSCAYANAFVGFAAKAVAGLDYTEGTNSTSFDKIRFSGSITRRKLLTYCSLLNDHLSVARLRYRPGVSETSPSQQGVDDEEMKLSYDHRAKVWRSVQVQACPTGAFMSPPRGLGGRHHRQEDVAVAL